MRTLKELADINIFFLYGTLDLDMEIESDIAQLISQPKKSLFYNRSDGCSVTDYENYPNTLLLEIMIRFDLAKGIYYRNIYVGDGTNGTKERRVAVSQWSIQTERDKGELNIQVNYLPFNKYTAIKSISLPVGIRG
jgi:hypothetical protein